MVSLVACLKLFLLIFFFNDTPTTEIYTLSLHDALPICIGLSVVRELVALHGGRTWVENAPASQDRKSTRLNSSHTVISYAVFCLKKKKKMQVNVDNKYPYSIRKHLRSEHDSNFIDHLAP